MKLTELTEKLQLTVLAGHDLLTRDVTGGYCSDLLSDVMGNAKEGNIWITLQVHKNIVAVAALKELSAILIVKGLRPDADVLALSESEGIPLLGTTDSAYETAGKMYQVLKR